MQIIIMPKITIVQLGKIPEEILTAITTELRENFNFTTETTQPIQIPKELFNAIRQQYPAPVILKFISERFHGRTLGITDEDLYAEDLSFVFGQAYCPGNASLISIRRLDPVFYKQRPDEKLFIERAVKEAVHEVGHMFGLKHCTIMNCVMSFSNTVGDVDRKRRAMCDSCRRQSPI
jgi:archaemetzincin